jgi:hypothetical protein
VAATSAYLDKSAAAVPAKGLLARVVGVVWSPRATYAEVAGRPRVLGALGLFLAIAVSASFVFMSTEVGQEALLDQQIRTMESFGRQVPDAMYARLEAMLPYAPYISSGYLVAFFPLATLVVAGILIAVFNAALGGNASFKQVYAVVTHSLMVLGLQQIFVYPLDYAKQSLSSPTSLAVFVPFLDEGTFATRLLGAIDLFLIWWIVNLSIGVAVLYRRRTSSVAATLLIVYGVIALIVAAVRTALSGA